MNPDYDWSELAAGGDGPTCPLPVVRDDYSDEERRQHIDRCGEPLELHVTDGGSLDRTGLGYMVPDQRLACRGGHVLLVADMEDRECEMTPAQVGVALAMLSAVDATVAGWDEWGEPLYGKPPTGSGRPSSLRPRRIGAEEAPNG